jgi:hypothetical protein
MMPRLERLLIVTLGVLVVLAVAIVVVLPRLGPQPPPTEQTFAPGETETMAARVIEVLEEGVIELNGGGTLPYQRLLLHVEDGSLAGEDVAVEEGTVNIINQERLFYSCALGRYSGSWCCLWDWWYWWAGAKDCGRWPARCSAWW